MLTALSPHDLGLWGGPHHPTGATAWRQKKSVSTRKPRGWRILLSLDTMLCAHAKRMVCKFVWHKPGFAFIEKFDEMDESKSWVYERTWVCELESLNTVWNGCEVDSKPMILKLMTDNLRHPFLGLTWSSWFKRWISFGSNPDITQENSVQTIL